MYPNASEAQWWVRKEVTVVIDLNPFCTLTLGVAPTIRVNMDFFQIIAEWGLKVRSMINRKGSHRSAKQQEK
jgi:hypothetical protein